MIEKRKSRSIPLMEYYEILQLEFFSYYFRYLYYEREQDKEKYLDFCKKKKESIQKLALRNCFHDIFTSDETFEKYLDKFVNESGLPNFTYRDDHQKKHLGYWDKFYFFKPGSRVIYYDSEWTVKKNLCKFGEESGFVLIERDNKPPIKVNYSAVTLIDSRYKKINL